MASSPARRNNASNYCSICAHDIRTPACPHPWEKPFYQWPSEMLAKLKAMIPAGPSDGS